MTAARCGKALGSAFIVTLVQISASAAPISVPNFSFEDPALNPGENSNGGNGLNDTTAITDWTITAPPSSAQNNGVFFPTSGFSSTNPLPAPADSDQTAYVFPGAAGGTCSIATTNSLGTVAADMLYTLTVALGNWSVQSFNSGTYTIEILANGTAVASNTLAGSSITQGTFEDLSANFTSPASGGVVGESLTIRLSGLAGANNDEGFFDNVRLDASAAVPEPGACTLLIVAAAGTFICCRRNTA
jgi:hypothetical protein